MKKTNEEILDFFGLKVGDEIKVDSYYYPFIIVKENSKIFVINCSSHYEVVTLIRILLNNEYEIVKPKKKVGEMKCGEINCYECPLRAIDCNTISSRTLYESLEKYLNNFNSFNSSLKPFEKALIDALKKELEKEVEECEK